MSTTQLKLIALLFMIIDHIAQFNSFFPNWFHWIGRLSAPIFFFCMAWGFYYTHNRKLYIIRLYICGFCMAILNIIIALFDNYYIPNNIFIPLFLSAFLIYIIDLIIKREKKGIILLLCFITWQILSTIIIILIDYLEIKTFSKVNENLYGALFGNCFLNEGGILFIILGILLYYTKEHKLRLSITYCSFSIIYTLLYSTNIVTRLLMKVDPLLSQTSRIILSLVVGLLKINPFPIYGVRFYSLLNEYWLIIFSLPFLLLYNRKKGNGYKYFFYIFYPLHIYFLYLIQYLT
ncbi:TraX family protein [Anaerosporobacter sp.]